MAGNTTQSAEGAAVKVDSLLLLKETIVALRGLHLQARAAMLLAAAVYKNADGRQGEDFACVAQSLGDLNIAMGVLLKTLVDQIHEAERAASNLH